MKDRYALYYAPFALGIGVLITHFLTKGPDSIIPYVWNEHVNYGPGTEPGLIWGPTGTDYSFGEIGVLAFICIPASIFAVQMLPFFFARLHKSKDYILNLALAGGLGAMLGLGIAFLVNIKNDMIDDQLTFDLGEWLYGTTDTYTFDALGKDYLKIIPAQSGMGAMALTFFYQLFKDGRNENNAQESRSREMALLA